MKHNEIEKQLEAYRRQVENIPLPEKSLDEAIQEGMTEQLEKNNEAEIKKKRRHYIPKWAWAAVILLLAGCVWTVYLIDPAFLRSNPSWEEAMKHEYYHAIDYTEEKDGITFTLHGAIMDEKNIVLFITIETAEKVMNASISNVQLYDENGKDLVFYGSYGPVEIDDDTLRNTFQHTIDAGISSDASLENGLVLEMDLQIDEEGSNTLLESFAVPIDVEDITLAKKQVYPINERIEIEGQKVTIEEVDIYPTRAEIHLALDPHNTKEILDFTDLRLEDGHGKVWGKMLNGVTSISDENDPLKRIAYMESSYFQQPEQLFVVISRAQAINKEESELIYSLDEERIAQAPDRGALIESSYVEKEEISFIIQSEDEKEFPFGLFSEAFDEEGNELEVLSTFSSPKDGKGHYGLEIESLDTLTGEIHIPLQYYPTFIEAGEEIKIPIK